MSEQKDLKKISLEKLEKLSDEDLLEKIKSKDEKVQKKKQYYENLHKTNLERFENYKKHKEELAKVCSTILSQRKSKASAKPTVLPLVEKKA